MDPTETSEGFCHVCGHHAVFSSFEPVDTPCKRNTFVCASCGACARNRHLARTILELCPAEAACLHDFARTWGGRVLLTCTSGAIHAAFAACPGMVASEYIDDTPSGAVRDGVLCQDLQRTSFPDETFDLVVTEDVFEHIPNPKQAYAELRRILKPGGYHAATIPVNWDRARTATRAVVANGGIVHLMEPEYHGDPTRPEQGILAFSDYGLDLIDEYLAITGPSRMLAAHGDRALEQEFGIYNSWVFVSQRVPTHDTQGALTHDMQGALTHDGAPP